MAIKTDIVELVRRARSDADDALKKQAKKQAIEDLWQLCRQAVPEDVREYVTEPLYDTLADPSVAPENVIAYVVVDARRRQRKQEHGERPGRPRRAGGTVTAAPRLRRTAVENVPYAGREREAAAARRELGSVDGRARLARLSPDAMMELDSSARDLALSERGSLRATQKEKIDARRGDHRGVPTIEGRALRGTDWSVPQDIADMTVSAIDDHMVLPMLERWQENRRLPSVEKIRQARAFFEREPCRRAADWPTDRWDCNQYLARTTLDSCGTCGRWFFDLIRRNNADAAKAWSAITRIEKFTQRRKTNRVLGGSPDMMRAMEELRGMQHAVADHLDRLHLVVTAGTRADILAACAEAKADLRYHFPHAALGAGRPTAALDLLVRERLYNEWGLGHAACEELRQTRPVFAEILIRRSERQHHDALKIVAREASARFSVGADDPPLAGKDVPDSRSDDTENRHIGREGNTERNPGLRSRRTAQSRAGRQRSR